MRMFQDGRFGADCTHSDVRARGMLELYDHDDTGRLYRNRDG